ncbi:MAG: hypothetical protein M3377_09335 [Actinomycetota bacterium]|nr:hypothetical protein [Actinomycetota bacterium]
MRARHPKKEIREGLAFAERSGWSIERKPGRGHAWGLMRCGGGCSAWIWSTPKNAGNHASQLRRAVWKCPHQPAAPG